MSERLLLPPNYTDVEDGSPVDFLAGPVQGSPDWQNPAAYMLLSERPDLHVASPRKEYTAGEFDWGKQVTWEKQLLARAAMNGVILFWFAAQDHSLPYEAGRSYAQTSRIELGRVAGWHDYDDSIRFVIGVDPQYTPNGGGNERYFRHTAKEYNKYVHRDIDSLLDEALSLA